MTVLDLTAESRGGWAAQITNGPGGYGGVIADEEWAAEVRRLADLRNATLLAHNYQLPAIQDVADHVGDSLALSRIAAEASEDTIVFCGVHFMAETAKILSPDKTVLIPDQRAGCSLADSITADELRAWKDEYPDAVVVSYVNTTAAVKALTDICCTSSNAVEVVASIPEDREVLFCPDQFLGAHVRRVTGRTNLHVWAGECHVHAGINGDELAAQAKAPPRRRAVRPSRMRLRHLGAVPGRRGRVPRRPGEDPVHRRHARRGAARPGRVRSSSRPRSACCTSCAAPHRKSTSGPSTTGRPAVHEDDHPRGAAALPRRGRRRGARRRGRRGRRPDAACSA